MFVRIDHYTALMPDHMHHKAAQKSGTRARREGDHFSAPHRPTLSVGSDQPLFRLGRRRPDEARDRGGGQLVPASPLDS